MQIHLANCNLTHPPLQHLPVDESPRGEEMKSVNILQCCHTMFAESAKERRNAFCQYPHTVQYNWFKKLLAHAMQTSRRKEEWGLDTKVQVENHSASLQHCPPVILNIFISRPKSPEALISLSIDEGHCFFESCKIIHLRQNSCLTNIACLYFTGLGGAVAEQIDKRELPSIHFALFQAL